MAVLPLSVTPSELRQAVRDAPDFAENAKTGVGQLPLKISDDAKKVVKGLTEIPGTRIRKDLRIIPMLIMPDLEKEYLDELNKKKIIS